MRESWQVFSGCGKAGPWIKLPALIILLRVCLLSPTINLVGCANMVAPSGGPRDSIPPELIRAQPADRTTGLRPDKLTLRFNEFVRLQNRSSIRLLPETNKQPIIRESLNQLEVDFSDVELDSATTYVLYMGDAIVDFTEGNKLKDFKRVFSTGSSIDTAWISGRVSDALNHKAKPMAMVGLYDWVRAGDSVVYVRRAPYWTTTNDSGSFCLGFLPERDFRLFVWSDDNKDGLYKAGEALDFLDFPARPLRSIYDSSSMYSLSLSIDGDEQSRIIDYAEKWPGWLAITFSSRPSVMDWVIEGGVKRDSIEELQYWRGDTAVVFVGDAYSKADLGGVVAVCNMIHRSDTLFRKSNPLVDSRKLTDTAVNMFPKIKSLMREVPDLYAGKSSLRFSADRPLERVNAAQFRWVDSLAGQEVQAGAPYQYVEGRLSIQLPPQLMPGRIYKLIIPRGSIVGAGEQAMDSVVQVFRTISDTATRNINIITTKSLEKCFDWPIGVGKVLAVEFIDEMGFKCGVFRFTDANRGQWDLGQSTPALLPGVYSIIIYLDENNNMRHDAASWRLNRRVEYSRTAQWTLSTKDSGAVQLDICELIRK